MPEFDDSKQLSKIARLRAKEEEELARILSQKYGVGYLDLTRISINTDALRLIKEEDARANEVAAFYKVGKKLSLAVRAPEKPEVRRVVKQLEELGYTVQLFMVSRASLERAWDRYADISFATRSEAGILDIAGDEVAEMVKRLGNLADVKNEIHETLTEKRAYRISRIVEVVMAGALSLHASDVHIEPEDGKIRLRFRIDGVLTDILDFDQKTYELILSRIKLLSGLKLNIKNAAQDGRFSIQIQGTEIEIRTSMLPGAYGESIVMRLLDPSTLTVNMEELGIEPKLLSVLAEEISRPNGMILNTGPTGSGKTTTLYSFLRRVHRPEIKIITIEDPVEYHLEGIVQTQVDKKNYTFASGLRSALRQDPDVIMVGEIRDEDVASTAIHAALTGHLVFSTLHTNNAAGTFPRLIDLGVNPKIIGSAVNVAMAQRLVRKLRPDAREKVPLEGRDKEIVDTVLASIVDRSLIPENTTHMFIPTEEDIGPDAYSGRIGVFEAIIVDEEIEHLIAENPSEREIRRAASKQGLLTLEQDGVLKVLQGITSMAELRRVIDLEGQDAMLGDGTPRAGKSTEQQKNPEHNPLNNT
ncbi:hypothetical protein COU17_03570 [Candidatus Kaiserbacteria bacterium CG10_big_fil_rev_8_21_14_0_10_49_17]|uniref:Bacterial type II secretion system protein E domain-containing protein n=1 Tax=Candidatus Kaiserbacteria bacterium CG10_big_fil_rev_8_21_14_0_10_49_17 TaxID=1974609 RepID=A0A2M6WDM4_9BACT|nr:MAG: hypothetical protein COU17_03570 [Candidatus Kaiserbacteria bacterium CG10_big_fil_rev_8_21_14_0_10_49_17]